MSHTVDRLIKAMSTNDAGSLLKCRCANNPITNVQSDFVSSCTKTPAGSPYVDGRRRSSVDVDAFTNLTAFCNLDL